MNERFSVDTRIGLEVVLTSIFVVGLICLFSYGIVVLTEESKAQERVYVEYKEGHMYVVSNYYNTPKHVHNCPKCMEEQK